MTQGGWTPLAHAATASTWSSCTAPPESLPLSRQVTQSPWEHTRALFLLCLTPPPPCPYYARLANSACHVQQLPTQLHTNPSDSLSTAWAQSSLPVHSCPSICCASQLQTHQVPSRRGLYRSLTFLCMAGVSLPSKTFLIASDLVQKWAPTEAFPTSWGWQELSGFGCPVTLRSCLSYCNNHSEFQFNTVCLFPTLFPG